MLLSREFKMPSLFTLQSNFSTEYSQIVSLMSEFVVSKNLESERKELLNLQNHFPCFLLILPNSNQVGPWSDKISAGSIPTQFHVQLG